MTIELALFLGCIILVLAIYSALKTDQTFVHDVNER